MQCLCKWLLWKRRVDTVGSTMELLSCISFGTQMVLPSVGAASMAASSLNHWQCHGDGSCPRRDGPNQPNLFLVWGSIFVGFFELVPSRFYNLQSYTLSGYCHYPRSSFPSLPQLVLCSGKEVGESIETIYYCMLSHGLSTECPWIFKIYYLGPKLEVMLYSGELNRWCEGNSSWESSLTAEINV